MSWTCCGRARGRSIASNQLGIGSSPSGQRPLRSDFSSSRDQDDVSLTGRLLTVVAHDPEGGPSGIFAGSDQADHQQADEPASASRIRFGRGLAFTVLSAQPVHGAGSSFLTASPAAVNRLTNRKPIPKLMGEPYLSLRPSGDSSSDWGCCHRRANLGIEPAVRDDIADPLRIIVGALTKVIDLPSPSSP